MNNIFKPDFKWRLIDRIRTTSFSARKGKVTDVYQKGEPKNEKYPISWHNWKGIRKYKVHIYSRNGDTWRTFASAEDVENFVNDCKKKIFWRGEFFANRSDAWKREPFTKSPYGKKPVPKRLSNAVIKFVVDKNHSTFEASKKFNKCTASIWYILHKAGCHYKRKREADGRYFTLGGNWVKV